MRSTTALLPLLLFATCITSPAQSRFEASAAPSSLTFATSPAASAAPESAFSSSASSISTTAALPDPDANGEAAVTTRQVARPLPPESHQRYGGLHEFTAIAGVSRVSGAIWGYRQDVDYEVLNLRYSRVMTARRHFTASYSPEITPYARLDEPVLDSNDHQIGRKHTTGGGVSPIGFALDFLPGRHIQPFWRTNSGMIYFRDRVLSPQGSQFMYTIDFGGGVHVYQSRLFSTTLGFRYIHLSNANISQHNPGTDAEIFYIGFSRFHSPKNRNEVR